ncbi:MAG: mechanosensitive ion channel domain-containing protein [Bacteroidales bacterium]|jgi:miniconductance mechanosensitive channel|nr:mechanosensitive ion channel domain-containing protein [Bacteroidales bacterium]
MNSTFSLKLKELLLKSGLPEDYASVIKIILIVLLILFLSWLAYFIVKKILVNAISRIVRNTRNNWDNFILNRKVLHRIAHLAPAIVIYYFAAVGLNDFPEISALIKSIANIYMIFVGMLVTDAFLSGVHNLYLTLPVSNERPIKGYIQTVKIIIYFLGIIFILSVILGKSPAALIAGLGAVAAILILVFKDTILGFVSSIQLSANKMVKPGDWIAMPSRNADGVVQEITLHTVKVQNWDKTISTIPTYALISESFQNWKGMEESKGRRISRSVYIDLKSVRFCTGEMLEKFKNIKLIRDYILQKQEEIEKYNKELGVENDRVSRRSLTNIGVFRKYVEIFLDKHPKIHPNKPPYITLVRHLQPTEKGLPIQIYCFSKEQSWGIYEQVQADIFDHILAVVPEFDLRVFQNPSGDDLRLIGDLFSQNQLTND